MKGKLFWIISSSERHLTAENIALALLKQITLGSEPGVIFGVKELTFLERIKDDEPGESIAPQERLLKNYT